MRPTSYFSSLLLESTSSFPQVTRFAILHASFVILFTFLSNFLRQIRQSSLKCPSFLHSKYIGCVLKVVEVFEDLPFFFIQTFLLSECLPYPHYQRVCFLKGWCSFHFVINILLISFEFQFIFL